MKKGISYLLIIAILSTFSFVAAQTAGEKVADTNDDRSMNWPGGSTIARAGNGDLMLVFGTLGSDNGDSLVYSVSYDDFLQAWDTPVAIGNGTGESRVISHANLVADADNNFHAVWANSFNIVHSKNDGSGWSTPVSVTGTAAPWDTLRAAHTALSIDSNGNLWVAFSTVWEKDDLSEWCYASTSTDGGATWSTPDTLFKDSLTGEMGGTLGYVHLATGPGGKVGVTVRAPKGEFGYYNCITQEYDGSTWGASEYLKTPAGGHVFGDTVDIYQLSSTYDDAGNRHFAFYTDEKDHDSKEDGQIYYTKKSTDGTWASPEMLTAFPGGAADYPTIRFGGNDDLYIAFFATGDDGIRRIYGVNSADLGANWTSPFQLSADVTESLPARPPSVSQTIGAAGADVAWLQPDATATGGYGIFYGLIPKAVVSVDGDVMPSTHKLLRNYPNPFNPSTTIQFGVESFGDVSLTVYNTLGQEVAQLVEMKMETGVYEVTFDARNLASGIYFYTLKTEEQSLTNKLMLLK